MQTHVPDKLEFLGSTSLFQSFPQAFWTTAGMNILIILCIFGSGHFYLFITVCLIYCTNTLIFATDNYFFSQCSNALLGRCPFFVNESKFTKLYFCNFSTVVRHCAMLSNVENISIYIYTSCSYLFQKLWVNFFKLKSIKYKTPNLTKLHFYLFVKTTKGIKFVALYW